MENKVLDKGKQVVIAATLLNFLTGIMYGWSIISKFLVEHYGWTSKEASLPYTIYSIAFVVAMIIFGKVQDKKGPTLLSGFGGFLVGAGLILSGFIINPVSIIITAGIIVGMGVGIISTATTPPVIKWHPERVKGKVTGIIVSGVALSSVFFSPLMDFLINSYGLLKTFLFLGIFILISSVFISQFLVNPPEGFTHEEEASAKSKNTETNLKWNKMIKTPTFYKLWFMLACSSTAGLMIISHVSNIAKIQANLNTGFILVITLSLFNTLGRLIAGNLSDKIGRINVMRIIFVLQGINMFLFADYNHLALILFGVSIAGLCYGSTFGIFPAITSDYYGSRNFGLNYGIVFTGWGLGGVIGPMAAASIFDMTGTYNTAYMIALALLAISIIITFTFKTKVSENI